MGKFNFKNKLIISLVAVFGLTAFISSCQKDNTTMKDYNDSTIDSLVSKIEYFHRVNIENDFSILQSKSSYSFSDICNLVSSNDMSYFNLGDNLDASLLDEKVLTDPISYIENYAPRKNQYIDENVIKDYTISLLTVIDNFTITHNDVEKELSVLKEQMLSAISDIPSSSFEYMVLKAEIEVFISSVKSWQSILDTKTLAKSSWWDTVKGYAKADAISGGANVLYNWETIAAAGAVTEGTGALATAAGLFAQGALVGSIAYGVNEVLK